jgi:prepilin-type N-terminal cleavage/methylation domain-containing protein
MSCRQNARAFTLIEMLLTLALSSLLIAVLMSSVFYGSSVQAALSDETVRRENTLRAQAWFAHAISGCRPVGGARARRMRGDATELECWSAAPIAGERWLSPRWIRFSLEPKRAGDAETDLIYAERETRPNLKEVIWTNATELRFAYRARDGLLHDKWPPEDRSDELLPASVEVVLGRELPSAAQRLSGLSNDVVQANLPVLMTAPLLSTPWAEPRPPNPFGEGFEI